MQLSVEQLILIKAALCDSSLTSKAEQFNFKFSCHAQANLHDRLDSELGAHGICMDNGRIRRTAVEVLTNAQQLSK